MSEWLNAKQIEIADTGCLFVGTVYNLSKEGINFKVAPHILDVIHSGSEEPYQRIDVGATIEIKAVIEGVVLRPANRLGTIDLLDKQDVRFSVQMSEGIDKQFFLSNCTVEKFWDLQFKGGEVGYVPMTIKSTEDSVLQILAEETLYGEDDGLNPDYYELLTEDDEVLTGYILAT